MPLFNYRFTATSLDLLAAHQVPWMAVLFVLQHAHPVVREHIGASILRIIGADQSGYLLMVTLREQGDDGTFDILSGRYLEPEESAAASTLLSAQEER